MQGAILHAPYDVRVEQRDDPKIINPTDAIIRISATCVCGSDLWPYRGIESVGGPSPMGHEYTGIVEETGREVTAIKPGQFVVGSFFASDNTCEICRAGYQSSCIHRELMGTLGAQAEYLRVPLAEGTLVATPDIPPADLIPGFLAASDVLGTGWFGAVAAEAGPGKTVAIIGDGAVGLLAVLAARQFGAERIIAVSRHEPRQKLAAAYGATDSGRAGHHPPGRRPGPGGHHRRAAGRRRPADGPARRARHRLRPARPVLPPAGTPRAARAHPVRAVNLVFTHFAPVTGTRDWTRHEVTAQVPADAIGIILGVFLNGPGQI